MSPAPSSVIDARAQALLQAAVLADWIQVVLNQGPPCFHLDGNRFCLRAERWDGHKYDDAPLHKFVSLADLLASLLASAVPAPPAPLRCPHCELQLIGHANNCPLRETPAGDGGLITSALGRPRVAPSGGDSGQPADVAVPAPPEKECRKCHQVEAAHCDFDEPGLDHAETCMKLHHQFVAITRGDQSDPSFFRTLEKWLRVDDPDGGEIIVIQFAEGGTVNVLTEKPLLFIEPERH